MMPNYKSLVVANYTFREIIKSKILINVFFAGLALILVTFVATEFTYGVPERVALDFGLGMLSISSLGISLFLGVTLLQKEVESRTIYMVISRPITRFSFILGKIVGLLGIQLINVLLLSIMTWGAVYILGGKIEPLFYWTIFFIFIESILLLLVVILISLFANTVISSVLALSVLALGHSIKDVQSLNVVKRSEVFQVLLDFYHFVLPAFHKLNLKDFVIYNSSLPTIYLWASLAYSVCYGLFVLILIYLIFEKKNLD